MMRAIVIATCLAAILVGCDLTARQAADIRHGAGDVASWFGVPRPIAEGVVGLVIAGVAHVGGQRRGHRKGAKSVRDEIARRSPVAPSPITGT